MPNSECSVSSEVTSELYQQQLVKANQGCAIAQYRLASMLERGKEVPRDDAMAFKWCYKSAEQNYAPAQNKLGIMYKQGHGVPKNNTAAVTWFRKATEQGAVEAQVNLARMLCKVYSTRNEALRWYNRAAEQGHTPSLFQLGLIYMGGRGIPRDTEIAGEYFFKAANLGHNWAQYKLNQEAEAGQDWAQHKLKEAAEQSHAWAQNLLNQAIANGHDWAKNIFTNNTPEFININLLVNNLSNGAVATLSGDTSSTLHMSYRALHNDTTSQNTLNISQAKNSANH